MATSAHASCEDEVWACNTRRRPYHRCGTYIWTSPRPVESLRVDINHKTSSSSPTRLQQVVLMISGSYMCCAGRHLVPTNLVHSLEVVVHGWQRVTRVITTIHRAVIHRTLVVNLCVLLQVTLVLESAFERNRQESELNSSLFKQKLEVSTHFQKYIPFRYTAKCRNTPNLNTVFVFYNTLK